MPSNPAFSSTPPSPPTTSPEETTTSTPPRLTAPLPAFSSRRRRPTADPLPEGTTVEESDPGVAVALDELEDPSERSAGTPRTTSSAGKPAADPKIVAGALAALIGVAGAVLAGVLARLPRRPRQLRRPTDDDAVAIAAPLARIVTRHVPAAALGPDLVDATELAAAVGGYVADGPLTYAYPLAPPAPAAAGDDETPED